MRALKALIIKSPFQHEAAEQQFQALPQASAAAAAAPPQAAAQQPVVVKPGND